MKKSRKELINFVADIEQNIGKLHDESMAKRTAIENNGFNWIDLTGDSFDFYLVSKEERFYAGFLRALAVMRKELEQE